MTVSLNFREGGQVRGTIAIDSGGRSGGAVKAIVGGILRGVGASGTLAAAGGSDSQQLGTFEGSWRSELVILCPGLGLHGIVHHGGGVPWEGLGHHGSCHGSYHGSYVPPSVTPSSSVSPPSPPPPAPLLSVDLCRLGPMRLPRLWSTLHDALLYNDPAKAQGGKVRSVPMTH